MNNLNDFLNKDELILWKTNPIITIKLYFLPLIIAHIIILIRWFLYDIYVLSISAIIEFLLVIPTLLFMTSIFLYELKDHKNTLYIITNQRVIIFKNRIRKDDLKDISQKNFNLEYKAFYLEMSDIKEFKIFKQDNLWAIVFSSNLKEFENFKIEFNKIREYLEVKKILEQLIPLKGEKVVNEVIFKNIKI